MKRIALSAGLLALLAGPAAASDIYGGSVKDGAGAALPRGVHWTGFEISGHGGHAWGNADVTRSVTHKSGNFSLSNCEVAVADSDEDNAPTSARIKFPPRPPVPPKPKDETVIKTGLSQEECEAAEGKWTAPKGSDADFIGGRFEEFTRFDDHKSHHSLDMDGWFGGAGLSYKVRRGTFIIEPFADVSFGGGRGSVSFERDVIFKDKDGIDTTDLTTEEGSISIKKRWGATGGLRVGVLASENDFVYALGGAAYGSFNIKGGSSLTDTNFPASSYNDTDGGFGYVVGAGWQRALDQNWKFGIEGRYSELFDVGAGSSSQIDNKTGQTFMTSESIDADYSEFSVLGRISYTFGN